MNFNRSMPLTYVREALSPGEKIIHVGRFHWFYDVLSWWWLFVGVVLGAAVVLAASGYVLHVDMEKAFPDIKEDLHAAARGRILDHYGGWIGLIRDLHVVPKIIASLCVLWGVFMFFHRMIVKYTTEIAVTTQRLVYKRGIVSRFVGEMKLDRIEGVQVWQSVFGRIFGYGRLSVHGIGVGEVILPEMEEPIRFRKALDYARTRTEEKREEAREAREAEAMREAVRGEGRFDEGEIPVDN